MSFSPIQVIQIDTANQATVLEAVSAKHSVVTSLVCTSERGIECVDGLCNNPEQGKWWTIEVNGDYEHANSQSLVKPSDRLVLKYGVKNENN